MSKVILKTLVSSIHEGPFVLLNALESFDYVDQFVICEFNRTHTGLPREFVFESVLKGFPEHLKRKIKYYSVDVSSECLLAHDNSEFAHYNEDLMRGYFSRLVNLSDNDRVISVDADEVIFGKFYNDLLNSVGLFNWATKMELYQFFYRVDLHWRNNRFIAPTVCYAKYYKKAVSRWRYDGRMYRQPVGAHFSWCIPVSEMKRKISTNAHQSDYAHMVNDGVLENAISEMTYPFQPERDVRIIRVNTRDFPWLYPDSMLDLKDRLASVGGEYI